MGSGSDKYTHPGIHFLIGWIYWDRYTNISVWMSQTWVSQWFGDISVGIMALKEMWLCMILIRWEWLPNKPGCFTVPPTYAFLFTLQWKSRFKLKAFFLFVVVFQVTWVKQVDTLLKQVAKYKIIVRFSTIQAQKYGQSKRTNTNAVTYSHFRPLKFIFAPKVNKSACTQVDTVTWIPKLIFSWKQQSPSEYTEELLVVFV